MGARSCDHASSQHRHSCIVRIPGSRCHPCTRGIFHRSLSWIPCMLHASGRLHSTPGSVRCRRNVHRSASVKALARDKSHPTCRSCGVSHKAGREYKPPSSNHSWLGISLKMRRRPRRGLNNTPCPVGNHLNCRRPERQCGRRVTSRQAAVRNAQAIALLPSNSRPSVVGGGLLETGACAVAERGTAEGCSALVAHPAANTAHDRATLHPNSTVWALMLAGYVATPVA